MNPLFLTVRSLAVEFAKRLYIPVAITLIVGLVVLLALSLWLTSLSEWWWILAIFVLGLSMLAAVVMVVVWNILKVTAPTQTKAQKKQAKALVDKIQRLAEVTATPKIFLFFQVVRDVVMPSKGGFIASLGEDTTSLHRDFNDLRNSFKQG